MKCANCNKDTEEGYCAECMQGVIDIIDALKEENKKLKIQMEYNWDEQHKDVNIYTLALCIAGGLVGVLSAYKAGEFDYAWYWNIITFVFYAFGGILVLGGVSLILSFLINYVYDSFKNRRK